MGSRREQILMTEDEIRDFLSVSIYGTLGTVGQDGYPHQINMAIGVREDGAIIMTSYAKAQKVLNLRRNPLASMLVEENVGIPYSEFRGVLLRGTVELIEDTQINLEIMHLLRDKMVRKRGEENMSPGVPEELAPKRVGIVLKPEKVTSWDHRKLQGVY